MQVDRYYLEINSLENLNKINSPNQNLALEKLNPPDLELNKLFTRINKIGYRLELSKNAKDFIIDKGYDRKYGARPLNRAIQNYIEDLLAENVVANKIKEGDNILLDYKKGEKKLSFVVRKKRIGA